MTVIGQIASVALLACAVGPRSAYATIYPGFQPTLVTDSAATFVVAQTPRPGYLQPTTDPVFATQITRVTGDSSTVFVFTGGVGVWGADARHHYSKDQPWNSAGTLLAIQNDGSPTQLFLADSTYRVELGKCRNYGRLDDRWHPSRSRPYERINVNGAELMWFDIQRCAKTRSWALPFRVDGFGAGEGNPSADGRFVALADSARVFVVDMDPQPPFAAYPAQRVGPAFDASSCGLSGGCTIVWVSISPSGKYVVVSYAADHQRVLDVDPGTLALSPRPMPVASPRCSDVDPTQGYVYDLGHADLAPNPFDRYEDVLVGQEHCGNRGRMVAGQLIGGVVMVRLRDGAITALTDPSNEAYPHHVSARNLDRPGWVYASYYPDSGKRFSDEIVAIKMDGSRSVQRFAHKHSRFAGCYRCESHAVPSRDGRRVLWASNWAADCAVCGPLSEVKAYIVDAREPSPNLVGNASFEQDSGGWAPYGGAAISRVHGGADGEFALSMRGPASLGKFGINDSPNWLSAAAAAGTYYQLEAWVRSSAGHGQCRLAVREYFEGRRVGGTTYSAPVALSPTWQLVACTYTAQLSGSTLDVQVLDFPASMRETFETDLVSIRAAPLPILDVGAPIPETGLASFIFPNPSGGTPVLRFTLAKPGPARVSVFDIQGRFLWNALDASDLSAGRIEVNLGLTGEGGESPAPGVYLCRIVAGGVTATRRFVRLR